MNDKENLLDIEKKIRSLPEPDYDKKFPKEAQDRIHENVLRFASTFEKKNRRLAKIKKFSVGLAGIAAFVLFAILIFPLNDDQSPIKNTGQQTEVPPTVDENEGNSQQDSENQNGTVDDPDPEKQDDTIDDSDTDIQNDSIVYENREYGFTFTLPKGWENYQIITDTWEGISPDQQKIEAGSILLIRHPGWTEDIPRQDIPIMIFTKEQWSSMEQGDFHVGAAPIGPTKLGENQEFVFALPARYNFAFPEGYEEVETILEGDPLQPMK